MLASAVKSRSLVGTEGDRNTEKQEKEKGEGEEEEGERVNTSTKHTYRKTS